MGFEEFQKKYLDPSEKRVIIPRGPEVKSFRLDLCNPIPKPKAPFMRFLKGDNILLPARPEEIVRMVLSLEDDAPLYQCGGPCAFEPQEGRQNYWVTDLNHRDPSAPQLTNVIDLWDLSYQIYPHSLTDIRDSLDNVLEEMKEKERAYRADIQILKKMIDNREDKEDLKDILEHPEKLFDWDY